MSLIAMACWDGPWNSKDELTLRTLSSLARTVDFSKHHRLFVCDNGSESPTTKAVLKALDDSASAIIHRDNSRYDLPPATVIRMGHNAGTAVSINAAWQQRIPGESCVKLDNDVVIHQAGWLDRLEDCLAKEPKIGILGLKRKDCDEWPDQPIGSTYKSALQHIRHTKGDKYWHAVERCYHVMGTCQLYASHFLDQVGYLYQFGEKYGYDDALMASRAKALGFWSCFYPWIEIDHIDPGNDQATEDKKASSGKAMARFKQIEQEYLLKKRPAWQGPFDP